MQPTSKQRAELKARAHDLTPVVHIGKYGLTPEALANIDKALNDHQLSKIKYLNHKEQRHQLSEEIASTTRSTLVDVIGNIAILYREKRETSE